MSPITDSAFDTGVPAPGPIFNYAQHLLTANAGRPGRTAFIDEAGRLTYGSLDRAGAPHGRRPARPGHPARGARAAADAGQQCDWPVSFLGAMYAGLVPVAVNTLLTADDYAYMLEHSRAQAVLVSGALLPTLTMAPWSSPITRWAR
jgi:benzoate-CoA ligase